MLQHKWAIHQDNVPCLSLWPGQWTGRCFRPPTHYSIMSECEMCASQWHCLRVCVCVCVAYSRAVTLGGGRVLAAAAISVKSLLLRCRGALKVVTKWPESEVENYVRQRNQRTRSLPVDAADKRRGTCYRKPGLVSTSVWIVRRWWTPFTNCLMHIEGSRGWFGLEPYYCTLPRDASLCCANNKCVALENLPVLLLFREKMLRVAQNESACSCLKDFSSVKDRVACD